MLMHCWYIFAQVRASRGASLLGGTKSETMRVSGHAIGHGCGGANGLAGNVVQG